MDVARAGCLISSIAFFDASHKDGLIEAIAGKTAAVAKASEARQQNYEACVHLLPQRLWDSMHTSSGPKAG